MSGPPGPLLSSATAELERQIAALVPEGGKGAVATVVDKRGITVGIGVVHRGKVTLTAYAELTQPWERVAPEARLKLKATW